MDWWRKYETDIRWQVGAAVMVATAALGFLVSGSPFVSATALEPSMAPTALKQDSADLPPAPVGSMARGPWTHGLVIDRLKQRESQPAPAMEKIAATVPSASHAVPLSMTLAAPTSSTEAALGSAVPSSVRRWSDSIIKYAEQHEVDPNLVAAIMTAESQGDPNAISPVGAIGLMQVMGGTFDPDTNIRQGVTILAENLQRFNGNLELSIAAYNAGPAAVQRYGGIPPFPETQTYVYRVLNRYYTYSAS